MSIPAKPNEIVLPDKKAWIQRLNKASEKPAVYAVKPACTGVVYLLIDCSGSMEGNKLVQAREGANVFSLEAQKKGYEIGLISFESVASHLLRPTGSIEDLKAQLFSMTPGGGTNLVAAFEMASDRLKDRSGDRIVFVVTDGQPNDREKAINRAHRLRRAGIDIMALGTTDADNDFLAAIVSRRDLQVTTDVANLAKQFGQMAKLLGPAKSI